MAGRRLGATRGRTGREASGLLAVAVVLALVASGGCATPLMVEHVSGGAGRGPCFVNTRLGYRIEDPRAFSAAGDVATGEPGSAAAAGRWQRIDVAGADLAFRRRDDPATTMIVASRCGEPDVDLRVLARHLMFGVDDRQLRGEDRAVVAGGEAWIQWFDSRSDGVPVRVKTVTTRLDGCLVDWVLASSGRFESSLPDFDRWWASLERPGGREVAP